jgi:hypothetical protein
MEGKPSNRNAYMREYMRAYRLKNPALYAKKLRRNNAKNLEAKTKVLTHYGLDGKLACCWKDCLTSDIDVLSVDHIADNGANHREQLTKGKRRTGGGLNFYYWLIKNGFPAGYQTLCYNHQWKKEILRRRNMSQKKACEEAV